MSTAKSTPDEIRARFDRDVERFSDLETGQSATIDAPLVLDLITSAAAAVVRGRQSVTGGPRCALALEKYELVVTAPA